MDDKPPVPDVAPLEALSTCNSAKRAFDAAAINLAFKAGSLGANDGRIERLKHLSGVLSAGDVDAAIQLRDAILAEIDPGLWDYVHYACAAAGLPGEAAIVAAGYAALAQDLTRWLASDAWHIPRQADERPAEVVAVEDRLRSCVAMVVGWAAVAGGRTAEGRSADRPAESAIVIGEAAEASIWKAAADAGFWRGQQRERRLAQQAEKAKAEAEALPAPEWSGPGDAVVVVAAVGAGSTPGGVEAQKAMKSIFRKPLPLLTADMAELASARETLAAEFPHGTSVVDALLADVTPGTAIRLRPTVLLGDPGGGKSRLARRLLEVLKIPYGTADASTTSDHGITGTRRGWHGAHPSLPVTIIERHGIANPALVVDELEKAGRSSAGSMHDALLSLVERSTAKAWRDQFLDADVDVSHVGWIFTANGLDTIPMPLRSRLRVLRLPRPGREHIPALARLVLRDLLEERGVEPAWEMPLDGEEIAALEEACGDDVSIRTLRRFVEGILDARRVVATRN